MKNEKKNNCMNTKEIAQKMTLLRRENPERKKKDNLFL